MRWPPWAACLPALIPQLMSGLPACLCLQREDFLPEATMDPMRGPRRFDGSEGGDDDDGEFMS